jgi:hypothetical protein
MSETHKEFAPERIMLDEQHPWPSLHAFTEENHSYFRGRDREVEELVRRIRRQTLTILFGVSGLGKTSLLQAGVFPALTKAGFLPILVRLDHESHEVDVVDQLRKAIADRLEVSPEVALRELPPGDSLWSLFHRKVSALRSRDRNVCLILVFDQFEEIFTRWLGSPEGESRRRHFLSELASLVENRPPEELKTRLERDASIIGDYDFASETCRIVISLREDYLPHLEDLKGRLPSVMENRFRLSAMDSQQALDAILGPGHAVVSESVAREIISFIGARESGDADQGQTRLEIDPALLSLICSELNAQRIVDNLPQISLELLHGRSHRILDEFYLRCFEFLPEEQGAAARAFVEDRLLTPAGHRGTVAVETAKAELAAAGVDSHAIYKLVHRRLLQVDERHGLHRVELAHDVLTKVVTENRNRRHELNAIEELRKRESAELADAKERADSAAAQIRRLRKARLAYGSAGAAFALLCVGLALLVAVTNRLKEQALVEKANAYRLRAEAETHRQAAQGALKLAEKREAEARAAEAQARVAETQARAAEESKNQLLLKGIPYRLCSVLASNDPKATEDFWAPKVVYYQYGLVTRELLISQHRRDNKQYPFRNYTVTSTPTFTDDPGSSVWIIKFGMNYTLLTPQRQPATGELDIILKVDRSYRVTQISQEVVRARKN